jgi:hypothetical protein
MLKAFLYIPVTATNKLTGQQHYKWRAPHLLSQSKDDRVASLTHPAVVRQLRGQELNLVQVGLLQTHRAGPQQVVQG